MEVRLTDSSGALGPLDEEWIAGSAVGALGPASVVKADGVTFDGTRPRLSSICKYKHIVFAFCCLALAMIVLQSFEKHQITSSLSCTWLYPTGVFEVTGPKTQNTVGDTLTATGRSPDVL